MSRTRILTAAARPLQALFVSDAFGGILLIAVAILAIAAANSSLSEAYHHLFHGQLAWTPVPKLDSLHLWINDALMAIFFFVVGLEVKREIVSGALADPRSRRLPVLAAVAGMAVPAVIFLQFVGGDPVLIRGWAIPAATDIAFAMGVIGLLGSRVPASLRLFLLTVAIVDDIGAVLVIALFYTASIDLGWLIGSAVVLAGLIAMNRMRVDSLLPFILGALLLWVCVLYSGVHATIAGVVAALTIPMHRRDGSAMLMKVEHALVGWNAYLVVPLFGFANAGVALGAMGLDAFSDPLPLAVGAGLVIGKQLGIFTSVAIADRIGFAKRPAGASWGQLWGTSVLCGIGFTMSLFISALAFPRYPLLVEEAKLGILAGSALSAVLGYIILRVVTPAPARARA
ncbi:Na+/H+ antiporter NhaA [Croceibacterium ferulae]|uniref:Na+/H+ antiporter NhaA n=1 Tax=Croceibacterium ferulae TaxID=1854641 RepID=UPI000EAF118E|nr:Na+/H+ antiporter NhaA [Croceibacterium ferulae]